MAPARPRAGSVTKISCAARMPSSAIPVSLLSTAAAKKRGTPSAPQQRIASHFEWVQNEWAAAAAKQKRAQSSCAQREAHSRQTRNRGAAPCERLGEHGRGDEAGDGSAARHLGSANDAGDSLHMDGMRSEEEPCEECGAPRAACAATPRLRAELCHGCSRDAVERNVRHVVAGGLRVSAGPPSVQPEAQHGQRP
eukprot:1521978-Prymnesium_polylepis.1